MRLSAKLLLILELVLLCLLTVLLVPVRQQMHGQVVEDMQNELRAIAATAALHLDGDLHARAARHQNPQSHAFRALRAQLTAIRDANGLAPQHIYTFDVADETTLRFAVMTHDEPFVGEAYAFEPHLDRARRTGRAAASTLYGDAHGQWISAAAPIFNRAGDVVGLLEVTREADAYFRRADTVILLTTAIALASLIIASFVGFLVLRHVIIEPLRAIHDGMIALGRHDFHHRVRLHTGDEFDQLAQTLNHLFEQFNIARNIQQSFLPDSMPGGDGYRFAICTDPCEATGGDYLDVFALDDERTAVLVADVTGHGLGPSLLMATCRAAVHALSTAGLEPGDLLERLERLLAPDLHDGRFVTMIYGILHRDGAFTYANASQSPALLRARHGVEHLESHRAPLGVGALFDLPEHAAQSTVHLRVRDRLLLGSDGVSEARSPDHVQFGQERIARILDDDALTCEQVVEALRNALDEHRAHLPPSDDVTILCVERSH